MSTYWKVACHDCRVWSWIGNIYDSEEFARRADQWASEGHEGHEVTHSSEYDDIHELRIEGKTVGEYEGYGCYKTTQNGAPYRKIPSRWD